MLKSIFDWLDLHPGSFWIIALVPTLLLIARLVILIGRESRGSVGPQPRAAWRDALVLFLFLLAWLWPYLLVANDSNPDESQLIAGAMTLTHDPVFWRSVDGGSSGPLNYYLLVPWHWMGAPLDYFTARLTGLLLIWGALFICLRTLARNFGRAVAWLGILPAAAFFATVGHPELTNLSTEHLPLFMIALVFGLLDGRAPADRLRLWLACAVAGALPWTKLQTAPICLALIGWACGQVWREPGFTLRLRWRRLAGAMLAAALPSLLLAGLVAAAGEAEAAMHRYLLQNLLYVGDGTPFRATMAALFRNTETDGRFPLLLGTVVIAMLMATVYFVRHGVRPSARLWAGGVVTLAALVAVVAPRREFLHYVLLLPVPFTFCLGAALGGWWQHLPARRPRLWLAGAFLAAGLLPLITRADQPVPGIYGQFAYHWRHPRSSAAAVLHALAGRESTLALWGWACYLHVESGLPQATRDGTTLWSIIPNPRQAEYRAVYLADLQHHAPDFFVDAVGQGSFTFTNRFVQAHEIFPELADYIRRNYTLVADLLSARIYARNDLARLRELSRARLRQLVTLGRVPENSDLAPPSSSLDQLQHKTIAHRPVIMLLPPTRVEWWLEEDVREVALDFGFDPVAYEQGRSNGAEIILELAGPQGTSVFYRRFLDPARQPADRGLQTVRIPLPPFAPETNLVLRTDPGPFGDDAWDWVYLAGLQLKRSPRFLPEQFPGFNRVPDGAAVATSSILTEGAQRLFMLNVPGSLSFLMRGDERHLNFGYGFRPGAYGNGGQTEGAVYRIELQGPGRTAREIFARHLQPVSHEADRGLQHASLTLPALLPGDVLILRIDPGPTGNVAWGWTYISGFDLK